eukprot:175695-Hanusia_phi.AAC.1
MYPLYRLPHPTGFREISFPPARQSKGGHVGRRKARRARKREKRGTGGIRRGLIVVRKRAQEIEGRKQGKSEASDTEIDEREEETRASRFDQQRASAFIERYTLNENRRNKRTTAVYITSQAVRPGSCRGHVLHLVERQESVAAEEALDNLVMTDMSFDCDHSTDPCMARNERLNGFPEMRPSGPASIAMANFAEGKKHICSKSSGSEDMFAHPEKASGPVDILEEELREATASTDMEQDFSLRLSYCRALSRTCQPHWDMNLDPSLLIDRKRAMTYHLQPKFLIRKFAPLTRNNACLDLASLDM